MPLVNKIYLKKTTAIIKNKIQSLIGRFVNLEDIKNKLNLRPASINIELTNICNSRCVFCGYQYQQRPQKIISDEVFQKTISDYLDLGGGDVFLTPIVGDSLLDPKFLERVKILSNEPKIRNIRIITNGILLDRFGIDNIVRSGIRGILISTAGFEEQMYKRVYRNNNYQRMKNNVLALLETRQRLGVPLEITIGLRTDRPLNEVMKDADFQPILKHNPDIDFTWSFYDFGGRIEGSDLMGAMKMRRVPVDRKTEPCKNLFDGPIILPDGVVMACSCAAAMDALDDLAIGNILSNSLEEIWVGYQRKNLIAQFEKGGKLNPTCLNCTAYRNLDFYRILEGQQIARDNEATFKGEKVDWSNHPKLHY